MYSQRTPLYDSFFNQSNIDRINRMIQDEVRDKTGVRIQPQNQYDLFNLMQSVYSVNNVNHTEGIRGQVDWMNTLVSQKASRQVVSGIMMNQQYQNDIQRLPVPPTLPISTTQYGKKFSTDSRPGW